ncbi:rsgI2 [Symbiodinium natans]|uniref:RsgI2 protein n=1 Tax=Symbiodinium natans TaxID=878477 RepID=A0A812M045_9DINO|nr:rsgI2 [Symbiodinium natans]
MVDNLLVELPANFSLDHKKGNRQHIPKQGATLPQWLVLYVVKKGVEHHAEACVAIRATQVCLKEGALSPAEALQCQQWFNDTRHRKRPGSEGSRGTEEEFFCWSFDRLFAFDAPICLRREQFAGKQLQRGSRPPAELCSVLSRASGSHLLGDAEENTLAELVQKKVWMLQVPAGLDILSQAQAQDHVSEDLRLWTPHSIVAALHVKVAEPVPLPVPEQAAQGNPDETRGDSDGEDPEAVQGAGEESPPPRRQSAAVAARIEKVKHPLTPLQEIQIVRLNFMLQNPSELPRVVSCVANFLGPFTGTIRGDVLQEALASVPGRYKVRQQMLRLDWLHMLHGRCVMQEQVRDGDKSVSRFLSMDASPQGGYEYLAMTEEVLVRRLPVIPSSNPWSGFEHEFRTMPIMSAIILEYGQANLDMYRKQVKGWVSDQGTERGIPHWPMAAGERMNELAAALQAEDQPSLELLATGTSQEFLFNSFTHAGLLHILFNALEETCKSCPRWDQVEKEVSAVSKLLTNRSFREVVLSRMMQEATAQEKKVVQGYHGELLSWRWESLHETLKHYLEVRPLLSKYWDRGLLSSEAALCDLVSSALQDPFHIAYVQWAFMFASFVQELAHWSEGCFCHDAALRKCKTKARRASIKCPWKGRRSSVLCAGRKDEVISRVHRVTSTSFTETMLELPTQVSAAMALLDQQARDKWASILKEKLEYLDHVPHRLAGAYAHHARPDLYGLQHSKRIVRECFEEYNALKEQGRTNALLQGLFERRGDAGLADQLWAFGQSSPDETLENFPCAWAEIQERASCSMVERSTERQHVLIKIGGRRTLRFGGPAMTCVRARRAQLQAMIDDARQCAFLAREWKRRGLEADLLSHLLTKEECARKTKSYLVSRIYGYNEADHFLDGLREEEQAAQALQAATTLALKAGDEQHQVASSLDKRQWMIVDYIKSQLESGMLFSVPEMLFDSLLPDAESEALQEGVNLDLWSFVDAFMTEEAVFPPSELVYCYVLDAKPEKRAQQKGLTHVDRRGHMKVLRFLNVDLQSPAEPRVTYSHTARHTLDLLKLATPAGLKLLESQCTLWASTAKSLQVQVMPIEGPQVSPDGYPSHSLSLPAFVTDDDMLEDLRGEAQPDRQALSVAEASQQQPQAVATLAGILAQHEEALLQTLLESRALGENFQAPLDLPYYNTEAAAGLHRRGLIKLREDAFGSTEIALSDATNVVSVLSLTDPISLCADEVCMRNPPGRNKLAWLKSLVQDGWQPADDVEDWHRKGGERKLPENIIQRPESHLKALRVHESIFEKPGGLLRISHSGSAAFYDFLLTAADLSDVQSWSLQQCREFAADRKRKAARAAQDAQQRGLRAVEKPLSLALDLPAEPSVPCRIPGMHDFVVHYDNWTHQSGHRRAFVQCREASHGNCRRYTFLRQHSDKATAVAWLLAWVMEASRFETGFWAYGCWEEQGADTQVLREARAVGALFVSGRGLRACRRNMPGPNTAKAKAAGPTGAVGGAEKQRACSADRKSPSNRSSEEEDKKDRKSRSHRSSDEDDKKDRKSPSHRSSDEEKKDKESSEEGSGSGDGSGSKTSKDSPARGRRRQESTETERKSRRDRSRKQSRSGSSERERGRRGSRRGQERSETKARQDEGREPTSWSLVSNAADKEKEKTTQDEGEGSTPQAGQKRDQELFGPYGGEVPQFQIRDLPADKAAGFYKGQWQEEKVRCPVCWQVKPRTTMWLHLQQNSMCLWWQKKYQGIEYKAEFQCMHCDKMFYQATARDQHEHRCWLNQPPAEPKDPPRARMPSEQAAEERGAASPARAEVQDKGRARSQPAEVHLRTASTVRRSRDKKEKKEKKQPKKSRMPSRARSARSRRSGHHSVKSEEKSPEPPGPSSGPGGQRECPGSVPAVSRQCPGLSRPVLVWVPASRRVPPTSRPRPAHVPPSSRPRPARVPPTSRPRPASVPPASRPRPASVPPASRQCPGSVPPASRQRLVSVLPASRPHPAHVPPTSRQRPAHPAGIPPPASCPSHPRPLTHVTLWAGNRVENETGQTKQQIVEDSGTGAREQHPPRSRSPRNKEEWRWCWRVTENVWWWEWFPVTKSWLRQH